jgi:GTP-binding protein
MTTVRPDFSDALPQNQTRGSSVVSRFPEAGLLVSAAAPAQFPPDAGAEVAFAGRSNAGKSTAINAITGRHGLARTSKTPGRTRLLNFFAVGPGRIVDLPGYGYAAGPREERAAWGPLIDVLRSRHSLKGLFLVVDSRRGLLEPDLELIRWADPRTRAVHVLLSKADKLSQSECRQVLASARNLLATDVGVQLFSALRRTGLEEAQDRLAQWLGLDAEGSNKKKIPR